MVSTRGGGAPLWLQVRAPGRIHPVALDVAHELNDDRSGDWGRQVPLPAWTADGLLPPGVHPACMADVYERFVDDAPNKDYRDMLFGALQTWLKRLQSFIPAGTAWLDGGFGTQKAAPPHDVGVVVFPDDWNSLVALPNDRQVDLYGLLTMQGLYIDSPGPMYLSRLQPMGGMLDAFISPASGKSTWEGTWSSVKDSTGLIVPGAQKGFVEVAW